MKISVIIASYKDIPGLSLVIESLKLQSYSNFEVVIAEDGESEDMKKFVHSIKNLEYIHTTHEDLGARKSRSQNNGILACSGEYLIFIDADCVLHPEFIASHAYLAQENHVLSGRRFNINESTTLLLKNKILDLKRFLNNFLFYNINQLFDRSSRFEQGVYINPRGLLYSLLFKNRKRAVEILGCHFSCYKSDIVRINGFDEGYGGSGFADDVDIGWRFKESGLTLKSCKNAAVMYHLNHSCMGRNKIDMFEAYKERMHNNKALKKYVCEEGLNTH